MDDRLYNLSKDWYYSFFDHAEALYLPSVVYDSFLSSLDTLDHLFQ